MATKPIYVVFISYDNGGHENTVWESLDDAIKYLNSEEEFDEPGLFKKSEVEKKALSSRDNYFKELPGGTWVTISRTHII